MRFFEPDETDAVTITLTAKDWLIICQCLVEGVRQSSEDPEIRHNITTMLKFIAKEAGA